MTDKRMISKKIKLMEEDLEHLQKIGKYPYVEIAKDEYLYLSLERLLERVVNRAIDINSHIIIEEGLEPPNDYYNSFYKMAEAKILPKKFVEKIASSAGLRNRLVHEYDDLDEKKIYASLFTALDQFPKYLQYIVKYLEKQ